MRGIAIRASVVVCALGALLAVPSSAGAVLSGVNGKIAFASGRDGTDATARLYYKDAIGSQGGGAILGPFAAIAGQQLRHPSFSPDRTKIVFAAGVNCFIGGASPCDLYTLDLTNPAATPVNITNTPLLNEDRPAWSPDGTRIAWEGQTTATVRFDIYVRNLGTGTDTNITSSADLRSNQKPAWSPDSQFIYYSFGDPNSTLLDAAVILRKPSNATALTPSTPIVNFSGNGHWQPSISPDGTHMCFTNQGGATATADVLTVSLTGALPVAPGPEGLIATTAGVAEYNCTWSPDGTKIAYVEGAFGAGNLVQQSFPKDVSSLRILADSTAFDGNPDWAPDAKATCPNITVDVKFNTPTSIPLTCTDQGPAYEQTDVREDIRDNPLQGILDPIVQGNPSAVVYTPKAGFTGADSFTYRGIDARSFGDFATVTLNVLTLQQSDTVKPDITALRVRPNKLKRGNALPKLGVNTGRRITFTLSEDAAVTLKFEKRTTGRRVGGSCRRTTSSNRGRPKCTRYVNSGSLKRDAKKGNNSLRFQGRLSAAKRLALGTYRLSATARDAAGNPQVQTRRKNFRLVRR